MSTLKLIDKENSKAQMPTSHQKMKLNSSITNTPTAVASVCQQQQQQLLNSNLHKSALTPKLKSLSLQQQQQLANANELSSSKTKLKRTFGVDLLNTNRSQAPALTTTTATATSIGHGKTPIKQSICQKPNPLQYLNHPAQSNSTNIHTPGKSSQLKSQHILNEASNEDNLTSEPVEHFFGNKVDLFDDLYDAGRINQMLENMRIAHSAASPIKIEKKFDQDLKATERQLRQMVKSQKRQQKKQLVEICDEFVSEMELPALPSFKMPSIFEDNDDF